MTKEYDKMRFINFIRPVLQDGKHWIQAVQKVEEPEKQEFKAEEEFFVAGRAYTMDVSNIFHVSPTENECGDFSKTLPFIVLENKFFPWEQKITKDIELPSIGKVPVPWVALIVISSTETAKERDKEKVVEKDITIAELSGSESEKIFFPNKNVLPEVVTDDPESQCHIIDMGKELYQRIMPGFLDMTYLTHVKQVDLADTEDEITEKDGEFSVVMANRFIPTGKGEPIESTVHLVSMLGMPEAIPEKYDYIRLVSLHHWKVYSMGDDSQTFSQLIEELSRNTGIIGCNQKTEVLKKGYTVKKHLTRSGEMTYSLYRSPLIPYKNQEIDMDSKATADGHLIYDVKNGVFDTSYAAAFQLGRLISLSRRADGQAVTTFRKKIKTMGHKKLLRDNVGHIAVKELCRNIVKEMMPSEKNFIRTEE